MSARRPAPAPPPSGSAMEDAMLNRETNSPIDSGFEARVLGTGDANVTILRSRISDLQTEVARQKKDLKEANDKVTDYVEQLNDQKHQHAQLLNKVSGLMGKLTAAEESEKQLEDTLLQERKNHQTTRDQLEQVREKIRQMSAKQAESDGRSASPHQAQAASIAAKDLMEIEEKHRLFMDKLRVDFAESLARLAEAKEDDDTAVFVARSAALSCASELEAKLNRLETQLRIIGEEVNAGIRDQEDEMTKLVFSLMEENKDLWDRLAQYQFEAEKAKAELSVKSRGTGPTRDQLTLLTDQIAGLEGMLRKAQQTVTEQTTKTKEHEDRMKDLLNEYQQLQNRFQSLEEERGLLANEVKRYESSLQEAFRQRTEAEERSVEIQRLNLHLSSQVRSLTEQIKTVEDTKMLDLRNQLRSIQNERDDANAATERYRSELEDALLRNQTLTREMEVRTQKYDAFKFQQDEQNSAMQRQLQGEINAQRESFERALADLRRELQEKTQEVYDRIHEAEEERQGRAALKVELRGRDDDIEELKNEVLGLSGAKTRLEEKLRAILAEAEQLKADAAIGSGKRKEFEVELGKANQEVAALQQMVEEERKRHVVVMERSESQWKEVDARRQQLEEEVRELRLALSDNDAIRAANARLERDKAQLMHENNRLQQQYEEVLRNNNEAQSIISRLKQKDAGTPKQQATIDELQRRLAELPGIRQQLEASKRDNYRLREEINGLVREKHELESRLQHYAEESRRALRKDADFERVLREATSQIGRLDQQIDETASAVSRRADSRPNVTPPAHRYY